MTLSDRKTNNKGILNKWVLFSCFAVLIFTWLLMPVSQANAETRKYKVNNQITRFEYIPILDTPGHIVGVFERQGEVLFEDGEKAKQILRGTIDLNRGKGTVQLPLQKWKVRLKYHQAENSPF